MVSKRSVVPKSPRRPQVANACQACRASKVKCSGKHPECARCTARGIECNFDVSVEGITRRQHLHNELAQLAGHKKGLERANAVIDVLQHGSDSEAVELLVCLRIGHTVDAAYDHIQKKRQGKSTNLPDTAPASAATSVTSDTSPYRPPYPGDNTSVQSLPSSTTTLLSPCWPILHAPVSAVSNLAGPTVTSDRSTAWPYPPTSNETQCPQQDSGPRAYAYQSCEDHDQMPPVSPLSLCSPSRQPNAQNAHIQQPYTREHLFFESTPRDAINPAMFSNPP